MRPQPQSNGVAGGCWLDKRSKKMGPEVSPTACGGLELFHLRATAVLSHSWPGGRACTRVLAASSECGLQPPAAASLWQHWHRLCHWGESALMGPEPALLQNGLC